MAGVSSARSAFSRDSVCVHTARPSVLFSYDASSFHYYRRCCVIITYYYRSVNAFYLLCRAVSQHSSVSYRNRTFVVTFHQKEKKYFEIFSFWCTFFSICVWRRIFGFASSVVFRLIFFDSSRRIFFGRRDYVIIVRCSKRFRNNLFMLCRLYCRRL